VADAGEHEQRADAEALSAGYERLRAAVLSGDAGGWRLGHGLLAARGMAGWMRAFGELAAPVLAPSAGAAAADGAPPARSARGEASTAEPVSLPCADQVVAVLAQMVLPLAA
jgi:hypothetical protein